MGLKERKYRWISWIQYWTLDTRYYFSAMSPEKDVALDWLKYSKFFLKFSHLYFKFHSTNYILSISVIFSINSSELISDSTKLLLPVFLLIKSVAGIEPLQDESTAGQK